MAQNKHGIFLKLCSIDLGWNMGYLVLSFTFLLNQAF